MAEVRDFFFPWEGGNSITFLEVSKAWASRPSVLSGLKMNTLHVVKQWF